MIIRTVEIGPDTKFIAHHHVHSAAIKSCKYSLSPLLFSTLVRLDYLTLWSIQFLPQTQERLQVSGGLPLQMMRHHLHAERKCFTGL